MNVNKKQQIFRCALKTCNSEGFDSFLDIKSTTYFSNRHWLATCAGLEDIGKKFAS
jgi:hypothetical protein